VPSTSLRIAAISAKVMSLGPRTPMLSWPVHVWSSSSRTATSAMSPVDTYGNGIPPGIGKLITPLFTIEGTCRSRFSMNPGHVSART
jgi:hypothetical protein